MGLPALRGLGVVQGLQVRGRARDWTGAVRRGDLFGRFASSADRRSPTLHRSELPVYDAAVDCDTFFLRVRVSPAALVGTSARADIFGGDGILHQPQYFAGYNLPEVTGYIGIFACIGAFTLLARSIGRSRSSEARTWSIWFVVLAVGLVLCFGTYSPLGGPLSHIPFYGGLRLQSRNLTIVDLGLAMLLAFWVNTIICKRAAGKWTGKGNGEERRRVEWQDVVGLVPPFVAAALCIALIAAPSHLESALGVTGGNAGSATGLWPWALLQLAVSIAAIVLVLGWPKLS